MRLKYLRAAKALSNNDSKSLWHHWNVCCSATFELRACLSLDSAFCFGPVQGDSVMGGSKVMGVPNVQRDSSIWAGSTWKTMTLKCFYCRFISSLLAFCFVSNTILFENGANKAIKKQTANKNNFDLETSLDSWHTLRTSFKKYCAKPVQQVLIEIQFYVGTLFSAASPNLETFLSNSGWLAKNLSQNSMYFCCGLTPATKRSFWIST